MIVLLLALVTSGLLSPQLNKEQPDTSFLLEPGRAGRIEVGMPIDEVYKRFGRENTRLVDLFKEGMFSPAIEIKLSPDAATPGIVADIREWPCEFSVWGITVRDPRFRTKEGFGVGTTERELRRLYSFKISEEEGAHAAIIEPLKMAFALSGGKEPIEQQRVISVWIWPDPVGVRQRRCPGR